MHLRVGKHCKLSSRKDLLRPLSFKKSVNLAHLVMPHSSPVFPTFVAILLDNTTDWSCLVDWSPSLFFLSVAERHFLPEQEELAFIANSKVVQATLRRSYHGALITPHSSHHVHHVHLVILTTGK